MRFEFATALRDDAVRCTRIQQGRNAAVCSN